MSNLKVVRPDLLSDTDTDHIKMPADIRLYPPIYSDTDTKICVHVSLF